MKSNTNTTPKKQDGTHYGPRDQKAWVNPYPLDSENIESNYSVITELLQYAVEHPVFGEYLREIIKKYKITQVELGARSGIDRRTIHRMITIKKRKNPIESIFAISFVLQLHPAIVDHLLCLANHNPMSSQCRPYKIIYEMAPHATYENIHHMCQKLQIEDVFKDARLKGQIA